MKTTARVRIIAAAAAALAVVTLIVIGALSHDEPGPGAGPAAPPAGPASSTTAAAEPEESHDDGVADASASPATISTGPAQPKEAAIQFMVKYLNTQGKTPTQWRAGFRSLVTAELADELANVDPAKVPAGQVADSKVTAVLIGDALQLVTVPIVAGLQEQPVATVKVTLTGTSGRWLVSDLDLETP